MHALSHTHSLSLSLTFSRRVDALGTAVLIRVDGLGTAVLGTGSISEVLRAGALHRPRALRQRRARRRFFARRQPHILPLHPIHAAAGELKALDAAAGEVEGAALLVLQHYLFCWYKSTNSECEWLGQIQKLTATCCTYCTLPADARIPGTHFIRFTSTHKYKY